MFGDMAVTGLRPPLRLLSGHYVHESTVQKATLCAAKKAGLIKSPHPAHIGPFPCDTSAGRRLPYQNSPAPRCAGWAIVT
jgi:hypothetical protein